jgi:hypothetical protein
MFDRLDFIYLPSRDVAADVEHFTRGLGAEVVFAIEAFGTRVAMVRLAPDPPPLLFAGHLPGDQPVLVYRVEDLDQAVSELRHRQVDLGGSRSTSGRDPGPTSASPAAATSESWSLPSTGDPRRSLRTQA